jgi:putative restriction endonuclease
VCALRHHQLLDAAHIVADREEAGVAAVRNGLALCKIHHAAYDCHVLGIRPDLVVEIRADLLDEVDGPMSEHGLKGRHGQRLLALPAARAERPDRELLERRYTLFRTAA